MRLALLRLMFPLILQAPRLLVEARPGVPVGGLKPFAAAPVPRLNEFSAPEPPPRHLRCRLLPHVRPRVPAVRQRPNQNGCRRRDEQHKRAEEHRDRHQNPLH